MIRTYATQFSAVALLLSANLYTADTPQTAIPTTTGAAVRILNTTTPSTPTKSLLDPKDQLFSEQILQPYLNHNDACTMRRVSKFHIQCINKHQQDRFEDFQFAAQAPNHKVKPVKLSSLHNQFHDAFEDGEDTPHEQRNLSFHYLLKKYYNYLIELSNLATDINTLNISPTSVVVDKSGNRARGITKDARRIVDFTLPTGETIQSRSLLPAFREHTLLFSNVIKSKNWGVCLLSTFKPETQSQEKHIFIYGPVGATHWLQNVDPIQAKTQYYVVLENNRLVFYHVAYQTQFRLDTSKNTINELSGARCWKAFCTVDIE